MIKKSKELLFTVSKDDFEWQYFKAPGNGGQKKNKTMSACRCIHKDSGAVGQASDHREQPRNRELAWKRCIETKRFQVWRKMEECKRLGNKSLEEQVEEMCKPSNIKVEIKNSEGKWEEVDETFCMGTD